MKLTDIINGMTPGPWLTGDERVYAGVKWDHIIRSARQNAPICSVYVAGYVTAKEPDANAAAIALAPNGVKALMLLREILAMHDEHPQEANVFTEARALLEGIEP